MSLFVLFPFHPLSNASARYVYIYQLMSFTALPPPSSSFYSATVQSTYNQNNTNNTSNNNTNTNTNNINPNGSTKSSLNHPRFSHILKDNNSSFSLSSLDSSSDDLNDEKIEAQFINYQNLHNSKSFRKSNGTNELFFNNNNSSNNINNKLKSPQRSYTRNSNSNNNSINRQQYYQHSRYQSSNYSLSRSSLNDITNQSINSSIKRKTSLMTNDNSSILSTEQKKNQIIQKLNRKDSKNLKNPYFYQFKENNQPKQLPPILPPDLSDNTCDDININNNEFDSFDFDLQSPITPTDINIFHDELLKEEKTNDDQEAEDVDQTLNFVDSRIIVKSRFNAGNADLNLTNNENSKNNHQFGNDTTIDNSINNSYFSVDDNLSNDNNHDNNANDVGSNSGNNSRNNTSNNAGNNTGNNTGNDTGNDTGNNTSNNTNNETGDSNPSNNTGSNNNSTSSSSGDNTTSSDEHDLSTRIRLSQRMSTGLFSEASTNPRTKKVSSNEINRDSIETVSTTKLENENLDNNIQNTLNRESFNPIMTIGHMDNSSKETHLKEFNLNNDSSVSIITQKENINNIDNNNNSNGNKGKANLRKNPPPLLLPQNILMSNLDTIPSASSSLPKSQTPRNPSSNSSADSANSTTNLININNDVNITGEENNLLNIENNSKDRLLIQPITNKSKIQSQNIPDLEKGSKEIFDYDNQYYEYFKNEWCPDSTSWILICLSILAPPFYLAIFLGYLDSTFGIFKKKFKIISIVMFTIFALGSILGIAVGLGCGLTS